MQNLIQPKMAIEWIKIIPFELCLYIVYSKMKTDSEL